MIDQFLDHLISYNNIITFCLEDQNTLSWSLCSSIDYQRLSYFVCFAMAKIGFLKEIIEQSWQDVKASFKILNSSQALFVFLLGIPMEN